MSIIDDLPLNELDMSDAYGILETQWNARKNDSTGAFPSDLFRRHFPVGVNATLQLINVADLIHLPMDAEDPKIVRIHTVMQRTQELIYTENISHCPHAAAALTQRTIWLSQSSGAEDDLDEHMRHILLVFAAMHKLEQQNAETRTAIITLFHPHHRRKELENIALTVGMQNNSLLGVAHAIFCAGETSAGPHFAVTRPLLTFEMNRQDTHLHQTSDSDETSEPSGVLPPPEVMSFLRKLMM